MKLKIDGKSQVKDIQREFAGKYEFLKIEFFKKVHLDTELSSNAQRIDPAEKIINLVKMEKTGLIDINSNRTVAEVEADFRNRFGLSAQVYRKSGDLWIETSKTDYWTLNGQNEEGRESCMGSAKKSLDEKLEETQWDSD